ncbi:MAG: DUF4232 domain-containing protein [Solirubrobacteraceae bacterium]
MSVRRRTGLSPRFIRGLIALSAVVAALCATALVGSPAGAAAPASAAAAPACQTAGLVVWINTQGNGTAGTIFYTLNFTNLSGHPCVLRGFPGVSAVNLRGQTLGRAASREPGQTVRTVTLTNGHTAHAVLGIVDIGALSPSMCPPTTAAGLRVFPPNQTASKVIPFPFPACGRSGGPAFLRIRPMTR